MREALLVGQADADGGAERCRRAPLPPASRQAPILQRVVLADVEVDVDRVLRDDGREDGRAVSVPPPLTKLPGVTSVRLMRPEMGAVMRQKLSSSSAALTRASATLTAASASRIEVLAVVEHLLGDVVALTSGRPRSTSSYALLTLTLAWSSSALA